MRKTAILALLLLTGINSRGQVAGDSVGSRLVSDISYDATNNYISTTSSTKGDNLFLDSLVAGFQSIK